MDDEPKCCGRIAAWSGGPLQGGCALCPESPTFHRREADGTVREFLPAGESYEQATWGEKRRRR